MNDLFADAIAPGQRPASAAAGRCARADQVRERFDRRGRGADERDRDRRSGAAALSRSAVTAVSAVAAPRAHARLSAAIDTAIARAARSTFAATPAITATTTVAAA